MPPVELTVIQLPPCRTREAAHILTARQRRDIIRILAKEGKAGLEKWLREEEKRDPYIRKRVAAEAEKLARDARAQERRIEDAYGRDKASRSSDWEKKMQDYAAREAGLRSRLESARAAPALRLEELAADSSLFHAAAEAGRPKSVWTWLRTLLLRVWYAIVRAWIHFIRTARHATGHAPDRATVITLPDGVRLDLRGLTSLDPRFVAQVRLRLKEGKGFRERLKQMWDRLLAREDYAEAAARLMDEELKSRAAKKALELDAEAADLERRLADLRREERQTERRRDEDIGSIEKRRKDDLDTLARRLKQGPYEAARDEILDDLRDAGLVDAAGDPTEALMERFSTLLLDEARRTLPAGGETTPGTYLGGDGEYHKAPLQSLDERGAIELVDSVIRARLQHRRVRHLYDTDLVVHREVRTSKTHVVLIFDQSGSMEEKGRLEAAKTVCLVMYRAVKEADPMNRVDILAMSTGITHVDLAGLWNAEPRGFTNHGAALREAARLLEAEGADRRLVYLITDGLPEAMTVRGIDTADRPEVCMPYALQQARALRNVEGTRLFVIQLESKEPLYVDAARKIAEAADGVVEAIEPQDLTRTLLVDWDRTRLHADRADVELAA